MKTINKVLTNGEIYQLAINLTNAFSESDIYFPAAANFCIQKNKSVLTSIAETIEEGRMNIIKHYGVIEENGNFRVEEENVEKANAELLDLLQIAHDLKIFTFNIESLGDMNLTAG
jgi:hypothetical protein